MRMENKFLWLRNVTAFCLMIAVFAATSLVASAAPEKNVSMGELIVSGNGAGNESFVILNGEKAFSGRTFFSNGTISTTETTTVTAKLGKSGSVTLSPNSALSLSFDNNSINGTLTSGQIKVSNSEGVNVNIVDAQGTALSGSNGVYNANMPAQQDDEGKVSDGSQFALIAVFAGVVAVAAIYVLTKDEDEVGNTVSPVR